MSLSLTPQAVFSHVARWILERVRRATGDGERRGAGAGTLVGMVAGPVSYI